MAKEPEMYSFYRPHKRVYADVDPVTGELVDKVSMTKQEFVKECDVNNIVKAFQPGTMHMLLQQYAAQGRFEELPDPLDYQEALNIQMEAEKAFLDLPAKVRERFNQEPGQFLAFMSDPANEKEARALGLLKPQAPAPQPVEVRVVNPEAPDPGKDESNAGAGGSPGGPS